MPEPSPRKTYSTGEAAAIIPCNERWLADRLRDRTFTARKIGRAWRLTEDDIDAIIAKCVATPKNNVAPAEPIQLTPRSAAAKRRAGLIS